MIYLLTQSVWQTFLKLSLVTSSGITHYYCTPIEEIAKEFGGDDLELRGWIDDYKSELAGFKATTKIVDYIKVCNDEEEIADSDQSLQKDIARYDSIGVTVAS